MQYSSDIKWKAKESIEDYHYGLLFHCKKKNSVTCIKMGRQDTDTIQAQKDKCKGMDSHFSTGNLHMF